MDIQREAVGWTLEHLGLAAAAMGAWDWDITTNRITWSDRVYELFGVDRAGFDGSLDRFTELIHEGQRAEVSAIIERALVHGPDDFTVRHGVTGLPERWLCGRGRVFRDETGRAIRMAGVVQDATDHRRAELEQRDQADKMKAALDASVYAVVVLDRSGAIVYCNEHAAEILGLSRSSVTARSYDAPAFRHTDVDGGPWPDEKQPFVRVMRSGRAVHGVEHAIETPDGRRRILRINAAPLKDRDGEIERVVCSFEDVTERRAIEEALRQSQKMEAIGRLAGGVAHDFNNLLTAILSFAAIARQRLRAGDHGGPAHGGIDDDLDAITEAGERAAGLTRQLLAFGRKDVRRPIVLDAGARVVQAARLLSRIVGEHVTVRTAVGPAPVYVRIDEGHLQQVLVNLAVNARDAMPRGGLLVLAVEGIDVEDDAPGRPAGAYVRIRVTDNGTGMDDATRARAIEPFFTTKALNEGTGLGLSTCHAIVVQAGGTLAIESAVGRGTTVLIDLPAVAAPEAEAQVTAGRAPASRGREQILVVEDDPAVRTVATRSLRAAGYDVLAAASGEQAREIVASVGRLDLVVCDIVLPGRSGFDVVAALRETRPGLPALFVSGYSAELPRTGDEPFLAKPYTPDLLTARVRAVLDARAAAQGG